MIETKKALTVPEAIQYQKQEYGCLAYGRDALYSLARAGQIPVIRKGRRKLLFPRSTIDQLMSGSIEGVN